MVEYGFEPDHFETLNPPQYRSCYTMKFEVPTRTADYRGRLRKVNEYIKKATEAALDFVNGDPSLYGYLEVECYSDKNKRVFQPFRPIREEGLRHFPFDAGSFEIIHLPRTVVEAKESKLALNSHKAIDVHIKIPTKHRGQQFADAHSPAMNRLRSILFDAGAYAIRSEGGNDIYTWQFLEAVAGHNVFSAITRFAKRWGGFDAIKSETCKEFRRTLIRDPVTGPHFCPIPPVARRRL
jgi:hypothetical protein